MDFYPAWPYFVTMAASLALIALPIFAGADQPSGKAANRRYTLDGLRGFLAFGVFFGHAALYHDYLTRGAWGGPMARIYPSLSLAGVTLFFMITGYLFWGKLLRYGGRPNWIALYIGRAFRIGPLYLCAVVIMLLLLVIRGGFAPHEPLPMVAGEILRWTAFGWFGNGPDINGYPNTWLLVAGVFWTLRYEWWFYASLLVLSLMARHVRGSLSLVLLVVALDLAYMASPSGVTSGPSLAIGGFMFGCGMVAASMEANGLLVNLHRHALSCAALVLMAGLVTSDAGAYTITPALLLAVTFYLIISGADLFGLLSCRPARRLGNISFGIYLLQGLLLAILFSPGPVASFALLSPSRYWFVVLLGALALMGIAAILHVVVERPGIQAGARVVAWLEQRKPARRSPQALLPSPPSGGGG